MNNGDVATIKRHRYVLDWFDIEDMRIEIKRDQYFEFQYRFGPDWYLVLYEHNGKEYVRHVWGRDDFRLHDPAQALAVLGDRVTKFGAISYDMGFHKALEQLLARAEKIKLRARTAHQQQEGE